MRYAILALLLTGCAQWTHPVKGEQEFYADDYECRRDATHAASADASQRPKAAANPGQPLMSVGDNTYWYSRCMRAKGWKPE